MKPSFYFCVILLLVLSFYGCESTSSSSERSFIELEEIYGAHSDIRFERYLNNWAESSVPVSDSELRRSPEIVRDVYNVFKLFYDPFNLNRYSGDSTRFPEVGNDFYSGVKNIIIQNSISYQIGRSYQNMTEIKNFRPDISINKLRILYLTGFHRSELDSFLNTNKYEPLEVSKRVEFLNQKLRILYGHWFGFHYITHPEVMSIQFNQNIDTAIVNFRIRYEGGEAVFVRRGRAGWEMASSKLSWIE